MQADLQQFLSTYAYGTLYGFALVAIFLIVERLLPAERDQPVRDLWFNVKYFIGAQLINLSLLAVLSMFVVAPLRAVAPQYFGWFAQASAGSLALYALAYYFAFDLLYYAFHRLQHVWPLLWREHLLHHSEISLNATTSLRQHWLEEPLKVFFMVLPLAVLFAEQPAVSGALLVVLQVWAIQIHANLRLPLGRFSWVLVGPQYHRVHHSRLPQHRDRNFAVFFPVIDWIFGTYVHPAKDEFPPTGLDDGRRIDSVLGAHLAPFKPPRKAAAD